MKQRYRMIDVVIQVALLTAWLVTIFIKGNYAGIFYFIVGGWFLISLVIHRFMDSTRDSAYNIFLVIVVVNMAAVVLGLVISPVFFVVLFIMLFFGPVMALLYTIVCFGEIKRLNKRPISLLK